MRLNPVLEGLATYPFVRLTQAAAQARATGADVIDFGIGEPREVTPPFIRRALAEAVEAEPVSAYPSSEGLPELREAIAAWCERRFGAALDPATEVVPTLGSKEAIFGLAQVVAARGDRVAVTTPGYPVPARGAAFAGADLLELPLDPARGWLPDLEAADWTGVALLWLNFPNNPTGATATVELLERAAALGRRHDFVVACDEAYSELWFGGGPPLSGLSLADRRQVVVFNTLSKRSSMPGYRSGFAAGDPAIVAALKRYRPNVGVAPPTFIQRAAIAAWGDEEHVVATRERYAAKLAALLPALEAQGMEPAGGDASFFLWLAVEGDAEAFALRLLQEHAVVVAPGPYFGRGGEGHVRVALVPTLDDCREAARRLGRT